MSGLYRSDDLKEELQLAGVKLDKIQDTVDQALGIMTKMDAKLDNIDAKLDAHHGQTMSVLEDTNEATRKMEAHMKLMQKKQGRSALARFKIKRDILFIVL